MRTPKVDMRITPTCTMFLFSQPTGHFQWPFTCSRLTTSSMSVPGLSGDSAAAAKAMRRRDQSAVTLFSCTAGLFPKRFLRRQRQAGKLETA